MTGTIAVTDLDPWRIEPWNDVADEDKFAALVESMRTGGWIGAPIVVISRDDADPHAVTGSHRVHAAREAGIEEIPAIEAADLLAAHGADLGALIGEYEEAGLRRDDAIYEVVVGLDHILPTEVVDHYGLDAH